MKESKNFICISSFNDDLEWFKEFDFPHIVYDKCFKGIKKTKYFPYKIKPSNLIKKFLIRDFQRLYFESNITVSI